MKLPRFLWRRWDETGRIPRWARIIWPRLHFCSDMDELLTGWERPEDLPHLCSCVTWPKEYQEARDFYDALGRWTGAPPF